MGADGDDTQKASPDADQTAEREHDLEALRATQEEARTVLDHQIQTFEDLDDKAAKTSRLNALLLGLLLTAGSFVSEAEPFDTTPYFNTLTGIGVLLLVASFVFSIATYTTTDVQTGVGSSDIRRLIERRYSEREWLVVVLRSEATWMDENERKREWNTTLLTTSHAALLLGVACVAFGFGIVHW